MAASTWYLAPGRPTRLLNHVVQALTRIGVSLWGSRVLSVRGRKSGEWRSTPVNVLTLDGERYLVSARGNTQWVRNLRAVGRALLQRLAAVRGRLSLCADQAAAAKWWLSMPMASVSAEGPMPKALSTRRTSPLMPGCRHQGRACPLRRARMTSNPLIVA